MNEKIDKDRLGHLICELWADDYYRFDLMSSFVDVHRATLIDEMTIEIQYEFWDDEHHASDDQGCFLFDIEIAEEYGENFPQHMLNVIQTVRYTWQTIEDRLALTKNLEYEDFIEQDLDYCDWDNPKIPEQMVVYYVERIDNEYMRAMLNEKYYAAHGLPKFIPERLVPYFNKILESQK